MRDQRWICGGETRQASRCKSSRRDDPVECVILLTGQNAELCDPRKIGIRQGAVSTPDCREIVEADAKVAGQMRDIRLLGDDAPLDQDLIGAQIELAAPALRGV